MKMKVRVKDDLINLEIAIDQFTLLQFELNYIKWKYKELKIKVRNKVKYKQNGFYNKYKMIKVIFQPIV